MPADLIIYALVAAGLVLWLRSVLGTRNGEERDRPNPYLVPDVDDHGLPLADGDVLPVSSEERIAKLAAEPGLVKMIGNKTAEMGLIEIARADRNFDIDFFLDGAQDAFAMIVESYADGDRETLKNLLAPSVYSAFERGISDREARHEKQSAEIHAIRKAEVIDAKVDSKKAMITVRFIADEASVTKDELGEIIAGHPEKTTVMKDIWTFGRDLKSKDPSWLVMETRADEDGSDNAKIPNAV